jgi:hypothetical protein
MLSCQLQRAVPRILVQPSIVRTHPSNMQWPRIELLPKSHVLPACNRPRLPAHLSQFLHQRRFIFGPQDAQQKPYDPICNLSQPHRQISALLVADQPRSAKINPDQGGATPTRAQLRRKLTGEPPTRNSSAAQPGRSQPRRREAFLRLARSHCIEAPPRQSLHCRNRRSSIVMRVVMVRRRSRGCVSPAMLVSQPMRHGSEG